MKKSKNIYILENTPVKKALLKLGLPTMVGMMVSAFYNLVDAYFVGMLGTAQQAAVAAVFPISLVMLGIGLLYGTGAASYLSRLLGAGKKKEADECASTAIFLAVITAMVLVVIMIWGINPLLSILGCTESMMSYAKAYAIPFIIGLVINVFNLSMSNIATAEGNSIYSMRSMLIGGIANIVLDPVFIIILKMGVAGAAYATLISRILSFSTYMLYLVKRKTSLRISVSNVRLEKKIILELYKIGVPTMIYQILSSLSLSITNNFAADYGDSAIAALGIVSRMSSLGFMTIMGFCKGYQTLVGYNYGAKNHSRIRETTKIALMWTSGFCVLCCIGMFVFRRPLILAFNSQDPEVLSIGIKALIWNAITFLTFGFQIVYCTKFMAMGKAAASGLMSIGRQGFFFIPIIYICSAIWGLSGIIIAQPLADIFSMLLVFYLVIYDSRKNGFMSNK